jgi:hypothetical protein
MTACAVHLQELRVRTGTAISEDEMLLRAPLSVAVVIVMGCTPVAGLVSRPAAREHTVAIPRSVPSQTEFKAELVPLVPPLIGDSLAQLVTAPKGQLTIELQETEGFEYHLEIRGAAAATYVSGQLRRQLPDSTQQLVAVLFSDLALTGQFVQLRGTAPLTRGVSAAEINEALQLHPESFVVHVEAQPGRGGPLHGVLR